MAEHNNTNDDINNTNDANTEPATKHDVGIGGGLGAVGGAIVGALAGGPVGLVIGAIAGGAASAGAIDVVDKHDHDYDRTVSHTDTTSTAATPTDTEYVAPAAATEYTGPGDFQRTPPAATTGASFADTAPAQTGYAETNYAETAPASTGQNLGTDTDRTVQLHEEVLNARTNEVQSGEVSLRKEVITETKSIDVPVRREEVVIERHAVSGAAATGADFGSAEEVLRVPVMEEQVTIEKTPIVTEEISLGKREVTETQHVTDTVRREEARIENSGNVDVLERGASDANNDRL